MAKSVEYLFRPRFICKSMIPICFSLILLIKVTSAQGSHKEIYLISETYTKPSCESYLCGYRCTGWWIGKECRYRETCQRCSDVTYVRYENRTRCHVHWSGPDCDTPICSPPCQSGFTCAESNVCKDIDECKMIPPLCDQTCTNTNGSFICGCATGYQIDANNRRCTDVDECAASASECEQLCENGNGSYTCACLTGYVLAKDGYSCKDVNECKQHLDLCGQFCINTVGSYRCSCRHGFTLDDNGTGCSDIDECAKNISKCQQDCRNAEGRYYCGCYNGYEFGSDGHNCIDIDECATDSNGCEQGCINTNGSYYCSCANGFALAKDGRSCANSRVVNKPILLPLLNADNEQRVRA